MKNKNGITILELCIGIILSIPSMFISLVWLMQ